LLQYPKGEGEVFMPAVLRREKRDIGNIDRIHYKFVQESRSPPAASVHKDWGPSRRLLWRKKELISTRTFAPELAADDDQLGLEVSSGFERPAIFLPPAKTAC